MPENVQDPNAQNPNPAAAAPGTPAAAASPDIAKLVADAVASAIAPLADRLTQINAPQATLTTPPPADDLDTEIQNRQNQLGAIERGELDSAYRPAVQTALSSAIARKEGRAIVERENMRGGFVQSFNHNLSLAHTEFPELKDPSAELTKETLRIMDQSPAYRHANEALNLRGNAAEKINWSLLDPTIALSAARQAHSIITRRNAGKPLSQQNSNPKAANVALESGAGAVPTGDDDLTQLEAKAVDTGNPSDWTRFIKARDQRLKQRSQMA